MMTWLVAAFAFAADPASIDAPVDPLSALRAASPEVLGPPTAGPQGALRYPLLRGDQGTGFVSLYLVSDVRADELFDGLARTAATHWPAWRAAVPSAAVAPRVLGDGLDILLARVGGAVVLVRDPAGRASEVVREIDQTLRSE